MDFSKAFDKVSHSKLLFKLHCLLRNSRLVNWISAYLNNRHQFVAFKGHQSNYLPVQSGVPQGSVLGPLLFLIFINDIVKDISVKIKLYADDCVLYTEVNDQSDQKLLNNDFQRVASWCKRWQMCINFEKTVFMRITRKKRPLMFTYNFNGVILSEVSEYKYLGLWISNDLRWNKHIRYVTANAYRKLFFLRRTLTLATPAVRKLAYNSIVLPVLDYAAVIWDPYTKGNILKLENVQKRAIQFIYNDFRRSSVRGLQARANLTPLAERNRSSRLKFLYQLIKGHYNVNVSEWISFSSGYSTRQRHELTITPFRSRNDCFKYSFFPRTVTDWNNLSSTIVRAHSFSAFSSFLDG